MIYQRGLVSIITPLYNAEQYIGETIQSVLNQTYKDWEMIIVDDASTDHGIEIVRQYSDSLRTAHRIKLMENHKNLGVARSRNRAIRKAKGQYIAFLDSDDLWMYEKLEKQISFMKKQDIAFCYSACDVIDRNGNQIGKVRNVPKTLSYTQLLKGNQIPCLTVVLDRSKIPDIYMADIKHEDYMLWLTILKNNKKAYGINEVLAHYRVDEKSVSSNKLKSVIWTWKIYFVHLKLGFIRSIYYLICYLRQAIVKRC